MRIVARLGRPLLFAVLAVAGTTLVLSPAAAAAGSPRVLSLSPGQITLPYTGGSVLFVARVSGANSCRLAETGHLFPDVTLSAAWQSCTSGVFHQRVLFAASSAPGQRHRAFRLIARRGSGRAVYVAHVLIGGYPIDRSSNWAGFIWPSTTSVTEVGASWTIPTLYCTPATSELAVWIGIDGAADTAGARSVFQDGSRSRCANGTQQNFLWWEWYPHNAEQDVAQVHAGDRIDADIHYAAAQGSAAGGWWWSMSDETTGQVLAASGAIPYSGPGATAEWIVEDPGASLAAPGLLARFPDRFTQITFAAMRLSPGPWSLALNHLVAMSQGGMTLATPRAAGDSSAGNEALIVRRGG